MAAKTPPIQAGLLARIVRAVRDMEKARGRADHEGEPSLSALAIRVLRYLMEHPDAGDTVEGILDWWLPQCDGLAGKRSSLESALNELEHAGLFTVLRAADHRSHYRLNASRIDAARALLKDSDPRGPLS